MLSNDPILKNNVLCLLRGTKQVGIIIMQFSGLISGSSAGDALFTKTYTHTNTQKVRGFEFLRIM